MTAITQLEIDQQVFNPYDEYCHGRIDRREFLKRAGALGAASFVMAQALLPQYAHAQTISFTDKRIKATYVTYPSPGGNSGTMRGYLVQPSGQARSPAVLVIHENRGLNPYIEDVARRAAVEGFVALAPDGLYPLGGYPGNDDDGRALQGKLGATGFCWGGGTTNYLAVAMGDELQAAVPFYGAAAETSAVAEIKAPLLLHFAQNDNWVNSMWPAYEQALKTAGASYEAYVYARTQHGFHNNSTPRYNKSAAKLAWKRTVVFFRKHLD